MIIFVFQSFVRINCDRNTNHTNPTAVVQVIELNQCPPEFLVLSKNNIRGGDSYEFVVKRRLKSTKRISTAKFEFIDLQNGAYLFFIPPKDQNHLLARRSAWKLRNLNWNKIHQEQIRAELEHKTFPSQRSLKSNYTLELSLLSSNCDSMRFTSVQLHRRTTKKHVIENLSNQLCIPHSFNYAGLLTDSENQTRDISGYRNLTNGMDIFFS